MRGAADLREWAEARQHPFVRAAYLVTGDELTAEDRVREALAALAVRWPRLGSERPEAYLRRVLYRGMIRDDVAAGGLAAAGDDEDDEDEGGEPLWGEERLDRAALRRLLGALPTRQRALVVLRDVEGVTGRQAGEVLGVGAGTVASELAAADATLTRDPDVAALVSNRRLGDRLDELARPVPAPDLVGPATAQAGRTRGRRRAAGLAALAVLALAVGGSVALDRTGDQPGDQASSSPAPQPSTPSRADEDDPGAGRVLATVRADELRADVGVPPDEEAELPLYPDAATLSVPRQVGWGDDPPPVCRSGGGRIRAALTGDPVRPAAAVVYQPRRGYCRLELDEPPRSADDVQSALAIAPERDAVAVLQDRAVTVVSFGGSRLRTVSATVPDDALTGLGWSSDGASVLVGGSRWWRVDAATGRVGQVEPTAGGGRWRLEDAGDRLDRVELDRDGRLAATRPVLPGQGWEVTTPSRSNIEGWTAAGISPSGRAQDLLTRYGVGAPRYGAIAVQVDLSPRPVAYLRPGLDPTPVVPLTWGPRDHLVLGSGDAQHRRLLVWDVINGRLWRLADVGDEVRDLVM